jgi:hypothetical protein
MMGGGKMTVVARATYENFIGLTSALQPVCPLLVENNTYELILQYDRKYQC